MKTFLKYVFLIALIFFVLEKGFYYFIAYAPKKEYDKRLECILEGKMNKDIVVLGSSRGANDIIAKHVEDATHFSTYNLSYRGSNILFHEFILTSLLKFNKPPQKVLLVLDGVFEFVGNSTLNFRNDRLLPLKKYNYVNDELIEQGEKNILSHVFCLSRIDRKDFSLRKSKPDPKNTLTPHGSILETAKLKKTLVYNHQPVPYTSDNEIPEYIDALRRIKQMCRMNGIELVFVFPPNFETFNVSFFNRFSEFVDSEKVLVYDTLNPKYKDESYYLDHSHLLKNGAEVFTSEIIKFLNKNKTSAE